RADWMPADPNCVCRLFGRSLRHRLNRYENAAFRFGTELNVTVDEGEQRVVLAKADVLARMPLGAALARQNVAGQHLLAAENLQPEALTVRVAAVARGAACFLVSHCSNSEIPDYLTRICDGIITFQAPAAAPSAGASAAGFALGVPLRIFLPVAA